MLLSGIFPPITTPFYPEGEVYHKKMESNVERYSRTPVAGIVVLGSTGEVWNAEAYMWLFDTVGRRRCPIINYSGGTEIAGGLLGCTVFRPIKPCGFNTAVPGVETVALDEHGREPAACAEKR